MLLLGTLLDLASLWMRKARVSCDCLAGDTSRLDALHTIDIDRLLAPLGRSSSLQGVRSKQTPWWASEEDVIIILSLPRFCGGLYM